MSLFDPLGEQHLSEPSAEMPLAARMRPRTLDTFVGQEHIIGPGRVLRRSIELDRLSSIIFWGPSGSGKTTLAHAIAGLTASHFIEISAVNAGVADIRRAVEEAKRVRRATNQRTILFVDEIHRFNKAQQDAILPVVESGQIILIGATTENPSFSVIAPLLSRCRVFTLNALANENIETIVRRALADRERGLGEQKVDLEESALRHLVLMANGDARVALNALELAVAATPPDAEGIKHVTQGIIEDALQHRALLYDKTGEQHYDIISALHKSMRGSDPDASLYWLGRMLEAGEDPLYIARRVVRAASEDVGMADPHALLVAMAAQQAVHFLGMPEGNLALAEAVAYIATAPKSNALYTAYSRVVDDVKGSRNEPVPLHLRNAVTPLMKGMGYGEGYKYAHDYVGHYVAQQNLPDMLQGKRYYEPTDQGFEQEVAERLKGWKETSGPVEDKV